MKDIAENEFWIIIIGIITAGIIMFTGSIFLYASYKSHLITKAIIAGVDPIEATYAISDNENSYSAIIISGRRGLNDE